MRFRLAAFAVLALVALAMPARAQSTLEDYDKARAALLSVWSGLPLSVRNVTLIEEPAPAFGNYTVHAGQSYRQGEPINVYVEALGYGWADNGDGTLSELLDADLNLLDGSGAQVAQQLNFLHSDIRSNSRLLETYLNLRVTLTSFDPGEYRLQFVLHDRAAGKSTDFEVPVTLLGADASLPGASGQ